MLENFGINTIFSFFLSLSLFATSIFIFKKASPLIFNRFIYTLLVFSFFILCLFYGVADYFTGKGINNAVIYYLKYGFIGAELLEYWEVFAASILYIILILIFSYWVFSKTKNESSSKRIYIYLAFLFILLSIFFNPISADLYNLNSNLFHEASADFNELYKNPKIKQVGNSRNLIFIYAEGLERTYFNESIFPGLIKELRKLQESSTYFTDIKDVIGAEHTIGGIIASQCGIPLFSPVEDPNSIFVGEGNYLPSATCLTDLLHQEDYYLAYYGGAPLSFAGKGDFYATHKFNEIYGRYELAPNLEDKSYQSAWGIYDDTLYDFAYKRFIELSQAQEKLALFLLTLDTHHPKGYPSKSCQGIIYNDGENPILNAIACSDILISKFINQIQNSPLGSKTTIVIVSDHLAHRNTASKLLNDGERRNLFMIIKPNAREEIKVEKIGSLLDVGPTILPFIGYKGAIGLGRNLLNQNQSSSEIKTIQENLPLWKREIASFWNFQKIEESMEIFIESEKMIIDKEFLIDLPVLIELNNELGTNIIQGHNHISDYILSMGKNTPFILIDQFKLYGETGYFLIMGRGDQHYKKIELSDYIKLNIEDIRNYTGFSTEPPFKVERIAHAGGGIKGETYTNSLDALNYNIENGFLYFELDFSFTKDEHLVCIHDWQDSFKKSFGFEVEEKLTLESFNSLVENNSELKNCTLDSLIIWLEENPRAYIITDVKEDNLQALEIISIKIPEFDKRVIPQMYDPNDYYIIKEMGYEQIIWAFDCYNCTNGDILKWVDKFYGPFAITMPKDWARSSLPKELAKKGIPTYIHTINEVEEKNKYIDEFGITEIYTDFLYPE